MAIFQHLRTYKIRLQRLNEKLKEIIAGKRFLKINQGIPNECNNILNELCTDNKTMFSKFIFIIWFAFSSSISFFSYITYNQSAPKYVRNIFIFVEIFLVIIMAVIIRVASEVRQQAMVSHTFLCSMMCSKTLVRRLKLKVN